MALLDVFPVGPPEGSIAEVAREDWRGDVLHRDGSTPHHRRRRRRDPRQRLPAPGTEEVWRGDPIGAIMAAMDTEPGGGKARCYVSALSQHPDSAQAAAEVTAQVLGQRPKAELAVFFVTPPYRDAVDDFADTVRSVLQPITLLGAAAVAVLGPRREVEGTPGVSLFAARLGSPAVPVRLHAEETGEAGRSADSRPMPPAPGRCSWSPIR